MIGLTIFTVIGLWLAISGWLAWWLARRTQVLWKRGLIFAAAFPVFVMAPLGDEVIGLYQFNRYCENAKEVKIYGRIAVGTELYTLEGRWKLDGFSRLPRAEANYLLGIVQSYLRWDLGAQSPPQMPAVIPVHDYLVRIFDVRDGTLLAEWHQFTNGGGWLKRVSGLGAGIGGHLLPQRCVPDLIRRNAVSQQLLVYRHAEGRNQ